ncbi:unnamed protein product [Absidia cylindrospora]
MTESLKKDTNMEYQEKWVAMAMEKWKRCHDMINSLSLLPITLKLGCLAPCKSGMPLLVATKEKARHPKELVSENVKDFINAFEDIMVLHKLNVEQEYRHRRFLPVAIGKAYRNYVDAQQANLTNGEEETWELVKDWMVQFTNTPKQVIKKITTYLDMTLGDGESGDEYLHRLQQKPS